MVQLLETLTYLSFFVNAVWLAKKFNNQREVFEVNIRKSGRLRHG